MMLEHLEALLRLYGALWQEEEVLGEVRLYYSCGAWTTASCCAWCSIQ